MKLQTWRSLHSLLVAHPRREVFQATHYFQQTAYLVSSGPGRLLDWWLLHGWSEHLLGSSFCLTMSESLLIIYAWGRSTVENFPVSGTSWSFWWFSVGLKVSPAIRASCCFTSPLTSCVLRSFLQVGDCNHRGNWYTTSSPGRDLQGLSIFT